MGNNPPQSNQMSWTQRRCTILLPAYNEAKNLPALLDKIGTLPALDNMTYDVVIVDDGSSDDTMLVVHPYLFERRIPYPVRLVRHLTNQGLGNTIKTGLDYLLNESDRDDEDFVVALDADNTHDPHLIPAMINLAWTDHADVVIASRYAPGGEEVGLSPFRQVCSRGASFLLDGLFRVPGARDYTCGFRLYGFSALRKLKAAYGNTYLTETGFTCMAELLLKLHLIGSRVREVPLILRYDLKQGASKMKVLKTILDYFKMVGRIRKQPFNVSALNAEPALTQKRSA